MEVKISPKTAKGMLKIEETLFPILWLNRIVGISVLEKPLGKPWFKLSFLYMLARNVAYGAFFWYEIISLKGEVDQFPLITLIYNVILYSNIVLHLIATVSGFLNHKETWKFIKQITLADETLEVFGIDPEHMTACRENMHKVLKWCGILLIVFILDITVTYYKFGNTNYGLEQLLVYNIPLMINPIIEWNFIVKIDTIGKRFERLNALIHSIANTPPLASNPKDFVKYQNILNIDQNKIDVLSSFHYRNRNNVDYILSIARQLHLDLCKTARKINDSYNMLLSIKMVANFSLITAFIYCLYLIYNERNLELIEKIHHYTSLTSWIVVTCIILIQTVSTSVNVMEEALKTSRIAHEIHLERSQNKITNDIHELSLQLTQNPLLFSASSLEALDFYYVRGVVGSLTTYLMLLIQNQPSVVKAINALADGSANNESH